MIFVRRASYNFKAYKFAFLFVNYWTKIFFLKGPWKFGRKIFVKNIWDFLFQIFWPMNFSSKRTRNSGFLIKKILVHFSGIFVHFVDRNKFLYVLLRQNFTNLVQDSKRCGNFAEKIFFFQKKFFSGIFAKKFRHTL